VARLPRHNVVKATNRLRVIGGLWRRRVLVFPDGEGLRPTPGRVRETLFNWLGQDLTGRHCLDLFAGSGALGFEAASRGAASVVMVEQSARVMQALRKNAGMLATGDKVTFALMDALEYVPFCKTSGKCFDVVFLDPPYRQGWLPKLPSLLMPILAPDALLYVEAEFPVTRLGAWRVMKAGRAGQVYFHLLRQEPSV
jgi:16S rRNA (guanine966-N2)-methyltransferase